MTPSSRRFKSCYPNQQGNALHPYRPARCCGTISFGSTEKIFFVKVRHALKPTFTVGFNAAHFYFELPLWQFNFARYARKTVKMRTSRKAVLNYNLQKIFFVKVRQQGNALHPYRPARCCGTISFGSTEKIFFVKVRHLEIRC